MAVSPFDQRAAREAASKRNRRVNAQTAATLHDLASCIESMASAMDEDDGILGTIAGEGIANHLAALPRHVREVFLECASDEAAEGYKADQRYFEAMGA